MKLQFKQITIIGISKKSLSYAWKKYQPTKSKIKNYKLRNLN
ncbi:hypothetical protein M2372_004665 [Chryseobacterium sp. BIGb0232]|nr:hypothetical protein [Chryseobacterium sp. BIGb0232]ROS07675.1 hypothetical protein EDF65_4777 [Chryseobacterium nakagawai]